jgi:excisionase family DNA binding protein
MTEESMYTVREAAERLRASEDTIRRWLRSGKLQGVMPGGTKLGYRIPASEVERVLRGDR